MKNMIATIGEWVKRSQYDIWMLVCVALIGWAAYNIGRTQSHPELPITMQNAQLFQAGNKAGSSATKQGTQPSKPVHTDFRVVTSKSSSSKKYHYSWCSSGSKIKPENQVWFATEALAQSAGFTLAGNCH